MVKSQPTKKLIWPIMSVDDNRRHLEDYSVVSGHILSLSAHPLIEEV